MTVKQTGGGDYNPATRPLYFAASPEATDRPRTWPPSVLVAVNEVFTESAEAVNLTGHLDAGRRVLLDSGIFWLTQRHSRAHGCTLPEALQLAPEEIDGFAELYDRYVELVGRYGDRLWGFIEPDQGGAANKRRTRARLEGDGIIPMPVYHPLNDGWAYFDEIASGYDRICLGNMVQMPRATRLRLVHTVWERRRAYPGLWVHVLGLTATEWCISAPPDSCDSSKWLAPVRFGEISTESAMLRTTKYLGPQFAYDVAAPAPGRDRPSSVDMCADAVTNRNLVWQHATRRVSELLGQGNCPAYLPGETPPEPPLNGDPLT
jgi:hypothetical protein